MSVDAVHRAYIDGAIDFFEFDELLDVALAGKPIDGERFPQMLSYIYGPMARLIEIFWGPGAVIPVNAGERIEYLPSVSYASTRIASEEDRPE